MGAFNGNSPPSKNSYSFLLMQASTIEGSCETVKHHKYGVYFTKCFVSPCILTFACGYTEAIAISNEHSKVLQSDIVRLQAELSESILLLNAAQVMKSHRRF